MFLINTLELNKYFILLHMYAIFGHVPIAAMIIFDDKTYAISVNSIYDHAEYILLKHYSKRKIEAILITLEPCISCAFHIIRKNIKYIFFSNYNKQYGGFKYLKHNLNVFGGVHTNNQLSLFFNNLR